MNIHNYRGCIAATSLLLALASAPAAFGQNEPGRERQQDSSRDGMEKIATSYKEFQQTIVQALEEKARAWQDKRSSKPATDPATDPNRNDPNQVDPSRDNPSTGNSGQAGTTGRAGDTAQAGTAGMQIRKEELLIAACSQGLLAGAPTADLAGSAADPRMGGQTDQNAERREATGQDPNARRDAGATVGQMGGERAVGLILVCKHDASGSANANEASGSRSAGSAMGTTGRLEPGAYCVKLSGSAITLTDKDGQTVLRTTLESKAHGASGSDMQMGRAGERDQAGRASGEQPDAQRGVAGTGGAQQHDGAKQNWEHVFSAVAKEAMKSMGWSKQAGSSSMR